MIHLVLDHSALIPCGDKPEEEKNAIRKLGETLPHLDVVWHMSRKYIKTAYSVLGKTLHEPLPKLQSFIKRAEKELLQVADTKAWHCKQKPLEGVKIKLHVIARTAAERIRQSHPQLWGKIDSLMDDDDDKEVLAIAALATHGARRLYLVTADTRLLDAAEKVAQEIKAITPRQLLDIVEQAGLDRDS